MQTIQQEKQMNRKEDRPLGLNIGSASIIMIFAILCLTVFSALSLVTAVSEKKTAQRFADATAAYYEADSEAVNIKNSIQAALDAGNAPQQAAAANNAAYEAAGATITYSVPLSGGKSQITAVLAYNAAEGALEVVSWEKTDISDWNPDESIDVWNGEDVPAGAVTE